MQGGGILVFTNCAADRPGESTGFPRASHRRHPQGFARTAPRGFALRSSPVDAIDVEGEVLFRDGNSPGSASGPDLLYTHP